VRFHFSLFLTLPLAACSVVHGGGSQEPSGQSLPEKVQTFAIDGVEIQRSAEQIAQTRIAAYSIALEELMLVSQRYPSAGPVVQSLVDHSDQTFEMFDGCLNYWTDFGPPPGQDLENWERNKNLTHKKHFPDAVGYAQAYPRSTKYTQVYAVAPAKYLVVLTCWLGPYWTVSANYLYDETQDKPQVTPLFLPTYDSATGQIVASSSNIHHGFQRFDEASRTLQLSHRFSGIGDCGYGATYGLENDEFVLQRFAEKQACDGVMNRYPQVYP